VSPLGRPHHDGSALYVEQPAPELDERVGVWLRVPEGAGVTSVHARAVADGEAVFTEARPARRTPGETWWRAEVVVRNPVTPYRFLLQGPAGTRWCNGTGEHTRPITDHHDFRLSAHAPPPAWVADAVGYEIFPDRFARAAGPDPPWPGWATPVAWDAAVTRGGPAAMRQLFGGDLRGVAEHLDHVAALGANLVWLTPVWPARSNHRYDAASFAEVDPMLGGDSALHELSRALHDRGMRLIGDLTTNHCGAAHPWFRAAQADPASVEAGFFTFVDHPDRYECWFGVPSLPKFDHRSTELRRRLVQGPGSVAGRWVGGPTGFDGWRIDVANMTGRQGAVDLTHEVARTLRATLAEVHPEAWLVAEHAHDASADLAGDGWHGTMDYAGFSQPVWQWLGAGHGAGDWWGTPGRRPEIGGADAAAAVDDARASRSWHATAASMALLGSHDTARWRTIAGTRDRWLVGAGMMFAWPSVPMVFAGDELGLEGVDAEAARRPIPWDGRGWDRDGLAEWRRLGAVRRGSPALRHGGSRWAHVGHDALAWLRETAEERVLCLAVRAAGPDVVVDPAGLGAVGGEHLLGGPDLRPAADRRAGGPGSLVLPGDGPAFHAWRLDT